MANLSDFLFQYFGQLRFNDMPANVLAQFSQYAKDKDFRGNMKFWDEKFAQNDGDRGVIGKPLPDPNSGEFALSETEWKKLFRAFQNAFRAMATDRDSFKDNTKATEYLDEYFGEKRLFSNATADPAYKTTIQKFGDFLSKNPQIEFLLKRMGYSDLNYSDFVSGIETEKYNVDPKFQKQLRNIAGNLAESASNSYYGNNEDLLRLLEKNNLEVEDLNDIYQNAFANDEVNEFSLEVFKGEYPFLLTPLYKNKKIHDVFSNYDDGHKICGAIEKAKDKIKYDDSSSDDYVPPRENDKLTPFQALSRWCGNTYHDVFEKWVTFGDRMFYSKSAESIIKALNSSKIKPTDGLEGILSKKTDIEKNLLYKSPRATDHFKWFCKTMDEIKSTMPKAFAGALSHGTQMQAVVSAVISKAVQEGKIEEAKTALEVLSVVHYGLTTSKIMDALKSEKFSVFSDHDLSWNKNQGVQFVTNALDKSVKAAFMLAGYGVTMGVNALRMRNRRVDNRSKTDSNAKWIEGNKKSKKALEDRLNNIDEYIEEYTRKKDDNIEAEANLEKANKVVKGITNSIELKEEQIAEIKKQKGKFEAELKGLPKEKNNLEKQIAKIENQKGKFEAELNGLTEEKNNLEEEVPGDVWPFVANTIISSVNNRGEDLKSQDLTQKINKLNDQINKLNDQIDDNEVELGRAKAELGSAQAELDRAQAKLGRAQKILKRSQKDLGEDQRKYKEFNNAAQVIEQLNNLKKTVNEEIDAWDENHKDKFDELVDFWNMLEGPGRLLHHNEMYRHRPFKRKSTLQKQIYADKGDEKKDMFLLYRSQQNRAA